MLYDLFSFMVLSLTLIRVKSDQVGLQHDVIGSSVDNQLDDQKAVTLWCQQKNMLDKPAECMDSLRQLCDNSSSNLLTVCKSAKNVTLVARGSNSNQNGAKESKSHQMESTENLPSSSSSVIFDAPESVTLSPVVSKSTAFSQKQSNSHKNGKNDGKRAKRAQKGALKKLHVKLNDRQMKQYNLDKAHLPQNDAVSFKRSAGRQPTPTELDVNDPENHFHGDMDLTDEQLQSISQSLDLDQTHSGRKKRKVGKEPTFHLWDKFPISYQFDQSVPMRTRDIITNAIKLWQENTCVRFQKDGPAEDKLEFVNGDGCSSFVGKAGGVQEVSLRTPGCDRIGVAAHEIGHSLGFFHEQSRPDQKENVKVNYPNIQFLRYNNFMPMPWKDVNSYDTPYDFGSVMHYDGLTKGFTYSEEQYSIITINPLYQHTIGQRVGPSFVDFKQVNLAYCSNKCPQKLDCQHNGYENPNSCSECKCPTGFGGRLCDTVQPSSCSEVLQAEPSAQYISTRNYPNNYTTDEECNWLILAPPGGRIRLEFVEDFSFPCFETCSESYVELKMDGDFQRTGSRLCCDKYPQGQPLLSKTDRAVVLFRSHGQSDKGFKLKYWSEGGSVVNNNRSAETGTTPSLPLMITSSRTTSVTSTVTDEPVDIFRHSTPKNPDGCMCSEWGAWEPCSQPCGGCGVVKRARWCNKKNCYVSEKRHCNYDKCPPGTNVLWNNGEFHFLVYGCCFGLLSNNAGKCTGLASVWNEFVQNAVSGNS